MTVEIKQSDTKEEIDKKIQALYVAKKERETERKKRMQSFFGVLKRDDIDPVSIQQQLRNEWD